jgi:hypothetical protein
MAVVRVVVVAAVVVVAVFFFKFLVATCRWVRLISRRWKSSVRQLQSFHKNAVKVEPYRRVFVIRI